MNLFCILSTITHYMELAGINKSRWLLCEHACVGACVWLNTLLLGYLVIKSDIIKY